MLLNLFATVCLALAAPAADTAAPAPAAPQVEHVVVYHNPKEFAGWPANEGIWSWGDEILVAFEVARYVETDDNHNVDRNSPKRIVFARSLDGGKTWTPEEHAEIGSPEYLEDPSKFQQQSDKTRAPVPCPGGINFAHPDFAMKMRGATFYTSTDRGRSWEGPYLLPDAEGRRPSARTSYIVTGPSSCLLFMTSGGSETGENPSLSYVIETTDGGKSFQLLSWIDKDFARSIQGTDDAKQVVFSIMPSAVRMDDGRLVVALRQRIGRKKWTDVFESTDNAKSWKKLGQLEQGSSNPTAMVSLGGKRLAAVYGWRGKGFGVRAKLSEDGGRTWGQDIVLRDDGREWDLGYARAVVRPDGTVVAAYYFTTPQRPQNHIAATLWRVPPADQGRAQR